MFACKLVRYPNYQQQNTGIQTTYMDANGTYVTQTTMGSLPQEQNYIPQEQNYVAADGSGGFTQGTSFLLLVSEYLSRNFINLNFKK